MDARLGAARQKMGTDTVTDTDKTEADGGAMTRLLIKLCSRARWHVGTLGEIWADLCSVSLLL